MTSTFPQHLWQTGRTRKVPAITTTAMGEALSDYLVHTIDPYIAVGIGGFGIVVALAVQFAVRRSRYRPPCARPVSQPSSSSGI